MTLVGLILLTMGSFTGAGLIVLGYFFEPIAGISLYITLLERYGAASHIFFLSAVVFTAGLPLIMFHNAYISIIGDVIKLVAS